MSWDGDGEDWDAVEMAEMGEPGSLAPGEASTYWPYEGPYGPESGFVVSPVEQVGVKVELLQRCARCKGDHFDVQFRRLTHPIRDDDGTVWAWWAPCPTNGEPILLREEAR